LHSICLSAQAIEHSRYHSIHSNLGWVLRSILILSFQALCPVQLWGPSSLLSSGSQGLSFLRVKWQGHEVDYLHPYNAKVKNVWSCTSTPPYVFLAWYLAQGNFTSPYLQCRPRFFVPVAGCILRLWVQKWMVAAPIQTE